MAKGHIVILLLGSITLSKRVQGLLRSIRAGDKGRVKGELLFLTLTIAVIVCLLVL